MSKSNQVKALQVGVLNIVNIVSIIVLIVFNIINSIEQGLNINQVYLVFIILLFMLLLFVGSFLNIKFLSLSYFITGVYLCLDPSGISDLTATIFFIFSFHIIKDRKYGVVVLILTPIIITVRSILVGDTLSGVMIMTIAYNIIYITYYFLIYSPMISTKTRVDVWKEISEKEKAILKLYMRGYDYAKISRVLNLTDKKESIRTIITRVRIKSECENDIQFGIWLSEKG